MSYLIDTNVIAEVRKGSRCDAQGARWWARVADADLFLSVLVLGEIRSHTTKRQKAASALSALRALTFLGSELLLRSFTLYEKNT